MDTGGKGAPELGTGAGGWERCGKQAGTGGDKPRAGLGHTSSWLPITEQLEERGGGVVQHCSDQGSHRASRRPLPYRCWSQEVRNVFIGHLAGVWPLESPEFRPKFTPLSVRQPTMPP